jgi:hypothetical protein
VIIRKDPKAGKDRQTHASPIIACSPRRALPKITPSSGDRGGLSSCRALHLRASHRSKGGEDPAGIRHEQSYTGFVGAILDVARVTDTTR